MKSYSKVANCGPVPYPDQSGRMLTDGVVSGDGWEALEALGFVVRVEDAKAEEPEVIAAPAVAIAPVAPDLVPEAAEKPELASVADLMAEAIDNQDLDQEDSSVLDAAFSAAKSNGKKSDKKHSKIKSTDNQ